MESLPGHHICREAELVFPTFFAGMNSLPGACASVGSLLGGRAGIESLPQGRVSISTEDYVGEGSCSKEKQLSFPNRMPLLPSRAHVGWSHPAPIHKYRCDCACQGTGKEGIGVWGVLSVTHSMAFSSVPGIACSRLCSQRSHWVAVNPWTPGLSSVFPRSSQSQWH